MRKLHHFGIPTTVKQANESYAADLKVWLTDISSSPNKIEYLRFEQGSCMADIIQTMPHIAYEVDSLEAELEGAKILLEPMVLSDKLTIAFIEEEGIAIEIMYCNE